LESYTRTESAHIRILGTTDQEFSSPASTAIAGGNKSEIAVR
jgi:hypothetical protein